MKITRAEVVIIFLALIRTNGNPITLSWRSAAAS